MLGDVAADDLPNVDDNIDVLSKALTAANLAGTDAPLTRGTADAAGALAKVLLRVGTNQWRQKKVRWLVAETCPGVQAVVAGLRGIVGGNFRASLQTDSLAVALFFDNVSAYGVNNPGLARLVERKHRETVQNRLVKQRAYVKVLTAIGQGHHELLLNIGKLKTAQVKVLLAKHAKDLHVLYHSFAELES